MSQPTGTHIARQFLELWQHQLASMMTDRDFVKMTLEMLQRMQQPMSNDFTQGTTNPYAQPTRGPAVSPQPGDDAWHQLERRLALCEKRIAFLESERAGRDAGSTRSDAPSAGRTSDAKRSAGRATRVGAKARRPAKGD